MKSDGQVVISTALDNNGLEKGLKNISGKFGGLAKVVGKAALAITAAFGAAAVAVTKQAADAYADYEQLTGGMETLFKNSASKIAGYAEDAFYTAGVSANKYMEIVTSFSASLISSLSGDTEKAANVANMALIDMSDNANKMGTAMESIQNAYQGFAKQNYTMLDNLKLGYGGTKTEMERLLRDAEAFSGVKYNINNLSDVYNAIHAIQEKLGVAGATAAEAEGTITGSANMTKAAWENVLTAISGGGDLDKAINNLVYSVSKYFDNIVPVVERSLAGIGQLIEKIAPQLVQTVATALIKAIPSLLNAVYQMIIGLAQGIYQGIIALFKGGSVTTEISAQLNGVTDSANDAADATYGIADATEAAGKAAKKSLAGFDELNTLADQSGGSSSSGVSSGVSIGSNSSSTAVSESVAGVSGAMQEISDKIKEMLLPLKNIDLGPAKTAFDKLRKSLSKLGKTIGNKLEDLWYDVLVPLGKWVIEKAAPKAIDVLSGAFEVLHAILEKVVPIIWDKFLKPLGEWTGELIIGALGFLADALRSVAEWVSKNAEFVAGFAITLGTLYGAFTAIQGAVSIFNSAMSLLSNPAAPLVLAAVAVAGLVGALTDLLYTAPYVVEEANVLSEAERKLMEEASKAAEAFRNQQEATNNNEVAILSQMNHVQKLSEELRLLVDENGRVKESDQARVDFILGQLNGALGKEYELVGGVISQYDELKTSIQEAIAVQKANLLLEANTKMYTDALGQQETALQNVELAEKNYQAQVEESTPKIEDAQKRLSEVNEQLQTASANRVGALQVERDEIEAEIAAEWNAINEKQSALDTAKTDYDNYTRTIIEYEKAYEETLAGNYDEAVKILTGKSDVYEQYVKETGDSADELVKELNKEQQAIAYGSATGSLFGEHLVSGILESKKAVMNATNAILSEAYKNAMKKIQSGSSGYGTSSQSTSATSTWSLRTPEIPQLAKGTVLPPNKPFMAIVGDQKHGTNVEAPLSTIQEAVAVVMRDFISSNMAGHEATVVVLREILEAVLGIQIGDEVIASAYDRYRTKMAIVKGG